MQKPPHPTCSNRSRVARRNTDSGRAGKGRAVLSQRRQRQHARCWLAGVLGLFAAPGSVAFSQSTIEPPTFRPRSDSMATQDADALREQLSRIIDSRGPINPLGDYVQPRATAGRPSTDSSTKPKAGSPKDDPEADQIPRIDRDTQRRLKSQPFKGAAPASDGISILPPPRMSIDPTAPVTAGRGWIDDGFRPTTTNALTNSLASMPTSWVESGVVYMPSTATVQDLQSVVPASATAPIIVTANAPQSDPAASIPPTLNGGTLGPPPTSLPSYSSVPSSNPSGLPLPSASVPSTSIPSGLPAPPSVPYSGAAIPGPVVSGPAVSGPVVTAPPTYGAPALGAPSSGISGPTLGPSMTAPPSVVPGPMIPSATVPGAIPPAGAASTYVPTTVYPAPPTYVVPNTPSATMPAGGSAAGAGSPYDYGPLPAYAKSSPWVNSAPFVSQPPQAIDAKWMVSPAVYRQATGANACPPGIPSVPPGMAPAGRPPGVANPSMSGVGTSAAAIPPGVYPNTVVPTSGLTPTITSSPFAYVPPAAMPPQTVYVYGNAGYVPLTNIGQEPNAQLGRGMWGQPTAYVDGQNFKNFFRYISP